MENNFVNAESNGHPTRNRQNNFILATSQLNTEINAHDDISCKIHLHIMKILLD